MKRKMKLALLSLSLPLALSVNVILTACSNKDTSIVDDSINQNPNEEKKDISLDANKVWNDLNNLLSKKSFEDIQNSKDDIMKIINTSFSEKILFETKPISIICDKDNYYNIQVEIPNNKNIIFSNTYKDVKFSNHILSIDNLSYTKDAITVEKIKLDASTLFSNLYSLVNVSKFEELANKKSEIVQIIKNINSSINTKNEYINIEKTDNKTVSIKIDTIQEEEIELWNLNNNVILDVTNKKITINNLVLKNENDTKPADLIPPVLDPPPANFVPEAAHNSGSVIINSVDAYLSYTGYVNIDIKAQSTLPKDHEKYKIYVDGVLQQRKGWLIPAPDSISSEIDIGQNNPLLEGHYVRVEIDGSSTGDIKIRNFDGVPSYQEPILNEDYFIAPWCPEGQEDNWKYRIVNPYTQNEWIKYNFGNAPLPMVNNVTFDDCYNMITTYVLKKFNTDMYFGKRRVLSETMSNAFVKWVLKEWKYYPYLSFVNGNITLYNSPIDRFDTEEDVKSETLITKIAYGIYEDEMLKMGNAFQKMATSLLTYLNAYIRPNMTTFDKVFAAFMYTVDWLKYNEDLYTTVSHYTYNQGVCANYAHLMAQVLCMIGVPALPMETGTNSQVGHTNVWVYMDVGNGQGEKWYASDPTFTDTPKDQDIMYGHPKSSALVYNSSYKKYVFFDIDNNDNYFDKEEYDFLHVAGFKFWGSKWFTPYKNNLVSNKGWTLGDSYFLKSDPHTMRRSRYNFYDGYWYYLESAFEKNYNSPEDLRFKRIKLNNPNEPEDVSNMIKNNFYNEILEGNAESDSRYRLGMAQFGNNFAFLNASGSGRDKKIIIHNMKDTNWENTKTLELPQLKSQEIYNFYFDYNGDLVVYDKNKTTRINDTAHLIKELNTTYLYENEEVQLAKYYFDYLSGYLKIGKGNFNITKEQKNQFYLKTEELTKDPSKSNFEKIRSMKQAYLDLVDSSKKEYSNNILDALIPQNLVISPSGFRDYGYDIPRTILITNIDELISRQNDWTRYNIYYSSSSNKKTEMKQIANGLSYPSIKKEMVENQDPTGYYYVQTYIEGMSQKVFDSNVFHISTSENANEQYSNFVDAGIGQINNIANFTNASNVPGWENKNDIYINYSFGSNLDQSKYKINWELKYINFDNKNISIIQKGTGTKNNYLLGSVNNSNHGIYYYVVNLENSSYPNQTIKLYSKFLFTLTKKDYIEFNDNLYIYNELISTIIKNENV